MSSKKAVIIGGGPSAKHAAEILVKKSKGTVDVTVIQANRFVESQFPMCQVLVNPELHQMCLATNCDKFQAKGVTYKYATATKIDTESMHVEFEDGETQVPFDACIVATGFKAPLLTPSLGVTVEERKAEVRHVAEAIKGASCVAVAGGGIIGLELAGNIRAGHPQKRVVLICRGGVLKEWPEPMRQKVQAQLANMNIEVLVGDIDAPSEASLQQGSLTVGGTMVQYDLFLPAFSQGPNTKFLEGINGMLDAKGRIEVNEFLQSKACSRIFAVGVSNAPEPFIAMPKLEAQWNSAGDNAMAFLNGQALKPHKEGNSFMKQPPIVLIGHGPKGFGFIDFHNLPPLARLCCCGGLGGWPCCPPCWPCCACAGCGCCPCGYCFGPPEGSGPAKLMGIMSLKYGGFHFGGMGEETPAQQTMS